MVSFKDALTVDGITYPTFQQAALAARLVEDENEATTAFQSSGRCSLGAPDGVD